VSRKLQLPVLAAAITVAALVGLHGWAAAQQSREAASASSSANLSASASQPLQEVQVTAQRAKLAKRVRVFVSKITGPLFNGGLTRWGEPVCPIVSGLPQQYGEFIRRRVSGIARAGGVPLASEKCVPNLFILVDPQPQELLKAMAKRYFRETFGFDTGPSRIAAPRLVVHEFISTPGPVRVLYRDATNAGIGGYPIVSAAKVGPITMSGDTWYVAWPMAPVWDGVWHLFRVFVIVDASQLKGVTLGQFADYVGMVGLAEIKPADSLADAPTILKLFSGAPQAAPAGMTDWDRAFLRSLYTTNQALRGARWHVVQSMVREIAH
jgi:hypothetical protein